jgi:hypothetical protein
MQFEAAPQFNVGPAFSLLDPGKMIAFKVTVQAERRPGV